MSVKNILFLAASTIKLLIFIIIFSYNSKAEENNIKRYSIDQGILSLMYHRFDEEKYPSTNIEMNIFDWSRRFFLKSLPLRRAQPNDWQES